MNVHLTIAKELGYLDGDDGLTEQYDILGRQLNRLIGSWQAGPPKAPNQQQATSN